MWIAEAGNGIGAIPRLCKGSTGWDFLAGGSGAGGRGAGGALGRFLWLGCTRGMALSGTIPSKIFSLSFHQFEMVR